MAPPDCDSYRKEGEPYPYGSPVDYRYEFQILSKLRDDERERLDRIESKVAALIAGAIAAFGFSLDKAGTIWMTIAAALYLVPIGILLLAFAPVTYSDAPDPSEFHAKFPWYPVTSIETANSAIVSSLEDNHPKIERKAAQLRLGAILLFLATIVMLGARFAPISPEALNTKDVKRERSPESASGNLQQRSATAQHAATTAANAGKHDVGSKKGHTERSLAPPTPAQLPRPLKSAGVEQ